MNMPWMRLHTRDWLDNKELRRCSPLARSVLADLMCLAHEGIPYGYLADKVGPLTVKYMASRCVVTSNQFLKALAELTQHERIQTSDTGSLFIGRMVEDEKQRIAKMQAGQCSPGNPKLSHLYNQPGFLYLVRRASDEAIKIGIAKDVQNRIYKLKTANRPDALEVVEVFEVEDMGAAEAAMHKRFAAKQVIGEWFSLDTSDIGSIRTSFKGSAPVDSRARTRADSDSDSVYNKKPLTEIRKRDPEVSARFEEVWQRWPRKTGKDFAARDWISVVTVDNELLAIACAERYLTSLEVFEGKVKNLGSTIEKTGWLIDCARDNWECDWPRAPSPSAQKSRQQQSVDEWDRV